MCSRATCRKCAKPTWKGCGEHIEQALKGVPKASVAKAMQMILKSQVYLVGCLESGKY